MNSYSKYKFSNNNIYSERALNPDLNVLKKPNSFNNINYQPNIQPTNLNLKNDIYSITEPDDEKEFSKTMNQNLKILENTLNKANSNLNNNKDYNYYNIQSNRNYILNQNKFNNDFHIQNNFNNNLNNYHNDYLSKN